MTFDPTKNEKPLGLLTEEDQRIMREWSHGWEQYCGSGAWVNDHEPSWNTLNVYRAKSPAMPEKIIRWINIFPNGFGVDYDSEYDLNRYGKDPNRIAILRLEITGDKVEAFVEPVE